MAATDQGRRHRDCQAFAAMPRSHQPRRKATRPSTIAISLTRKGGHHLAIERRQGAATDQQGWQRGHHQPRRRATRRRKARGCRSWRKAAKGGRRDAVVHGGRPGAPSKEEGKSRCRPWSKAKSAANHKGRLDTADHGGRPGPRPPMRARPPGVIRCRSGVRRQKISPPNAEVVRRSVRSFPPIGAATARLQG